MTIEYLNFEKTLAVLRSYISDFDRDSLLNAIERGEITMVQDRENSFRIRSTLGNGRIKSIESYIKENLESPRIFEEVDEDHNPIGVVIGADGTVDEAIYSSEDFLEIGQIQIYDRFFVSEGEGGKELFKVSEDFFVRYIPLEDALDILIERSKKSNVDLVENVKEKLAGVIITDTFLQEHNKEVWLNKDGLYFPENQDKPVIEDPVYAGWTKFKQFCKEAYSKFSIIMDYILEPITNKRKLAELESKIYQQGEDLKDQELKGRLRDLIHNDVRRIFIADYKDKIRGKEEINQNLVNRLIKRCKLLEAENKRLEQREMQSKTVIGCLRNSSKKLEQSNKEGQIVYDEKQEQVERLKVEVDTYKQKEAKRSELDLEVKRQMIGNFSDCLRMQYDFEKKGSYRDFLERKAVEVGFVKEENIGRLRDILVRDKVNDTIKYDSSDKDMNSRYKRRLIVKMFNYMVNHKKRFSY